MDVVDEVKKIKKKEQELYKFILQQFLDLEEFKKSFSSSIAKTVDTKLEQIDKVLSKIPENEVSGGSDLETIKKVILENLHLLRGEKGERGERGEKGEQGEKGERGEKGEQEQNNKIKESEESISLDIKPGYCYDENGVIPDIFKTLEKYNSCSIFLKTSVIGIFILPKPNESFLGKELLIMNTSSSVWKIRAEEGVKIGGQTEKILNKLGNYLKLVSDGEKYYIL